MSEDASDGDEDWFESALEEDDEEEPISTEASDAESGRSGAGDPWDDAGAADSDADAGDGTDSLWSEDTGSEANDEVSPWGDTEGSGAAAATSESDAPFAGEGGNGEGMFDDDFGSAFGGAGGEGSGFEDEEFESELPRIDIGIQGLDDMIQGGIPQRHLLVCVGGAGSGKTTFGLQFLHHGLQQNDKGVFITLEQSHETIMDTANERGWEFDRYEAEDKLAVVDLDPVEMANSLDNIRSEMPALIEQFGADRLVLDSVSLLEMMYDDPAKRRTEVFDFTRSLKKAGVTTFLTSEANESNPYASRHGIIEYLTDGVFFLQYVRAETRETRLAVEIQKIRNSNHSREKKPYEITMDGISVYQQANIF